MRQIVNIRLIEIGKNIRKWRDIYGIKQEILANDLEISSVSLSKIETGKADISILRLYAIADALGIKIESLFSDPYLIIFTTNTI